MSLTSAPRPGPSGTPGSYGDLGFTEEPTSPEMFKLKASLPPGAAESEIFTILMKKSWAGFSASLIQNAAVCRASVITHLLHVPDSAGPSAAVAPPTCASQTRRRQREDTQRRTHLTACVIKIRGIPPVSLGFNKEADRCELLKHSVCGDNVLLLHLLLPEQCGIELRY